MAKFCVTYLSSIFRETMILIYFGGHMSVHTDILHCEKADVEIYYVTRKSNNYFFAESFSIFSTLVYLSRCFKLT